MNEREFEIVFTRHLEHYLGVGWRVAAHQLCVHKGRIDLLAADPAEGRHIIELKKGSPQPRCVIQVLDYKVALRNGCGTDATCWIIANEISPLLQRAADASGVRTLAISEDDLLGRASNLDGPRKTGKAIYGGDGTGKDGLWVAVDEAVAYRDMPSFEFREVFDALKGMARVRLASGSMQTVIKYREVKVGGINRRTKGGHFYIGNGLVYTAETKAFLLGMNGQRIEIHADLDGEVFFDNEQSIGELVIAGKSYSFAWTRAGLTWDREPPYRTSLSQIAEIIESHYRDHHA